VRQTSQADTKVGLSDPRELRGKLRA